MKFLVLLLAGVAAVAAESSLLRDAKPLLQKLESLPIELQRSRSGQSLAEALDLPESDLADIAETQIRGEIGRHIRELLENLLSTVSDTAVDAKDKLTEILNQLDEQSASEESAQKFIASLTEVQDDRKAVGDILDHGFEEKNLEVFTWYSIEERGIKDWWNKVKNWFKGVGSWISDKFDKFKEWAKGVFQKVIDAAKPIIEQVKQLAIQFLKENWDKMSIELVKQAMNFFVPFSGEIGAKVMEQLIKIAREHGWIPWEKFYLIL